MEAQHRATNQRYPKARPFEFCLLCGAWLCAAFGSLVFTLVFTCKSDCVTPGLVMATISAVPSNPSERDRLRKNQACAGSNIKPSNLHQKLFAGDPDRNAPSAEYPPPKSK